VKTNLLETGFERVFDIGARDLMHVRLIGVAFVAWYLMATVSVGVADAATIKEVVHCRAIVHRSKMIACFKALKRRPAKAEDAAPTDAEGAAPAKKDETGSATTEGAAPTDTEGAAWSRRDDKPPATAETAPPNVVPPSSSDELITTSSIDSPKAPSDRPLCVDRDALAGMLVAGLLTSDPALAVARGCQALPSDAKIQVVERYPAVFSFMRMIAVKVMSPTRPDLGIGFTIEVDPPANDGSSHKAPQ
jgi:hypothetical protein